MNGEDLQQIHMLRPCITKPQMFKQIVLADRLHKRACQRWNWTQFKGSEGGWRRILRNAYWARSVWAKLTVPEWTQALSLWAVGAICAIRFQTACTGR